MSTRAERPRTLDPYLGAVLNGRHRIDKLIGRGGMGLVYLATDTVEERQLVIKLLAPHWLEDATAITRFDREGKRLQQMAHPNVVRLLECGHDRGQTYIAMEYLDGEPLRRYLKRRGLLPLKEFTPIAAQILSAVSYAHDRSIMLRDIKPANIMLCERDGKANFVKLLDFGLAKLVDGDEEITKSHVIGTAGYLAPEQIKGDPCDVRVDVYAIGVMLYLMLTGESPIQGENDGALLYNHVHGTPKPLGSVLPAGHAIPEALIALVHQCLEKDPARRPADASEIAEALFESVPPKLFALPEATADTRKELAEYRSARDRGLDPDAGPPSSEWTKPIVRPVGDPSPAEASTASLPRPPRRGTPALPPPRRASQPHIPASTAAVPRAPAGAVPPVRLARPGSDSAIRVTPPTPARGETLAPEAARTAVSTPRPVDTTSTATMTPMPEDVSSGPLAVTPSSAIPRHTWIAAGVLALGLGCLSAWAVFGGTPTTQARSDAATTAVAAAPANAKQDPPSAGTASNKPPILVPISLGAPPPIPAEDEPVVVAPEPESTVKSPVVVRALEGARIEIDGVDSGAAPLQTDLSVGKHVIRIVAPGHTPWEQTVDVIPGKNPIVEAKLRAITKKRKSAGDAAQAEPDEFEPASDPLPTKKAPIKPVAQPTTTPKAPPPPPPAPEPTSDPFLPTAK